jgi:hypothetical protein
MACWAARGLTLRSRRTSTGMALGPRTARVLCCASRAKHHAGSGPLSSNVRRRRWPPQHGSASSPPPRLPLAGNVLLAPSLPRLFAGMSKPLLASALKLHASIAAGSAPNCRPALFSCAFALAVPPAGASPGSTVVRHSIRHLRRERRVFLPSALWSATPVVRPRSAFAHRSA